MLTSTTFRHSPQGRSATLRGAVASGPSYGSDGATSATVSASINPLFSRQASADLSGLVPATTFHYCVVAVNAIGVIEGHDLTFTTAAIVEPPPLEVKTHCRGGHVKLNGRCVRRKHRRSSTHERRSDPTLRRG